MFLLVVEKIKKLIKAHRAVAETFIDNPYSKPQINHIDGNKLNNCVNNLEWVTAKENSIHTVKHGLWKPKFGEDNPVSKLTKEDVEYIREHYIPRDDEYGCEALARKFNVHHSRISDAYYHKTYKDIA